ncbi:hypothetical protein EG329_010311 [Mollisiaceae sp. DMI_Dod_QoI]|nr:hypothetical protein EG329_010311 [Helotiales sp. DMI_Dod_QoI]
MAPEHITIDTADEVEKTTRKKGGNATDTVAGGWMSNPFKMLFSPSKGPTVEERMLQEDDEIMRQQRGFVPNGEYEVIQPRQESPAQADSTSEQVTSVMVEPPNRKRPLPRDEYAVNESSSEESALANKRTKRLRASKQPLVQAKTSREPVSSSTHRTRRNGGPTTAAITSEPTRALPPASTTGHTNAEEGQSDQSTSRKRGRPRKNPLLVPAVEPAQITPVVEEVDENYNGNGNASAVQDLGQDEGITDILLNPSPVKSTQLPRPTGESGKQLITKYPTHPSREAPQASDDDEEAVERNENIANDRRAPQEDSENEEEEPLFVTDANEEGPLVNMQELKAMLRSAKHVGHTHEEGAWKWQYVSGNEKKTREKVLTAPGKYIDRRTQNLTSQYRSWQQADETRDITAQQESQVNIECRLSEIEERNQRMISMRLTCAESDKRNTRVLLADLYFNIVPHMLETIIACAKAKIERENIQTRDLQEFKRLVQVLFNAAVAGIAQKREHQPVPGKKSYQISKPTRGIVPGLKKLLRRLNNEVNARMRKRRLADQERLRPERERRRREEEVRIQLEFDHRRRECIKSQWDAIRIKLSEPIWGEMKHRMIAKAEVGFVGTHSPTGSPNEFESAEQDDDHESFTNEYNIHSERVRGFPGNNNKDMHPSRDLSWDERIIFINIMRGSSRDERKYELAQQALQRSLDEIFAIAKDFQDLMDYQHGKGKFNEPCDDWTYHVWATPENDVP